MIGKQLNASEGMFSWPMPNEQGEGGSMELRPVRRNLPVREIKAKKVYSTRRFPMIRAYFFFWFLCGLSQSAVRLGAPDAYIFLACAFALPFVLWLFYLALYGAYTYKFVAEDGYYIVRHGRAAYIPWDQVACVEVSVRELQNEMCFILQPGIAETNTHRPPVFGARDNVIPYNRKALECIREHVPTRVTPG